MGLTSEDIIRRASRCLKKGENKVAAEVASGIGFYEKGDLLQAEVHYRRALNLDPQCAEAHAGLGITLAQTGKIELSLEHLETAHRLDSDCGLLANWLADAFFDRGNYDRAIELYNEALRLDASDSNAQNDMADAYRLKGDHATALTMYERALVIDPGDTNAILEKAQCLLQLQNNEAALKVLQTLIDDFPSSRDRATAMAIYGTILQKTGMIEDAGRWYESALEFFPYNRQVLFEAAVCAINSGKRAKGTEYLQRLLEINPGDEQAVRMLQKARHS